ncbi:MAG: cytochrome b/b6 domain-containing protein [Rhodospirillaceae bacterium]|nr:cytochrome b/b6 domain-containing protein [Rhodospirillaceae bacterium]
MQHTQAAQCRAPMETRFAKHNLAARPIHWVLVAGFAFTWTCGYAMTTLVAEDSPLEELLFGLHISTGVTLLALFAVRVGVRVKHAPPPLPDTVPPVELVGARLRHATLYGLPVSVIAMGWFEVGSGGHGVE